ncbi:MAG: rod shape-determining protein RodA, partial [Acidobacteria bacterium]|nr:rod shape-determining protein RodA [Acidobacteriota bacterium]
MGKNISLRDFDWLLLAILLTIAVLGVVQIYSTTAGTKFAGAHVRQIYWILGGVAVAFFVSLLDYRSLLNYAPWFYLGVLVLLVATLLMGVEISGGRRWLRVGGNHFQVSEIAKLSIILLLARFFGGPQEGRLSWADLGKVAVAVGVPLVLIARQPDLGTALTLVPIVLIMLFVAGMRLRFFAFMLLAAIVSLPIAWHHLKPYQKERIATFLEPEQDPQNAGYQVLQSRIAVGAGELWGKGTAQGTQTQLRFLPVPHTDFIFSAYAEEHGFTGVLLALSLYFVVLMRIVYNAQTAADRAGTFLCLCVCLLLLFHLLVNVGMVVGRMPVTGIPLPFMSYGGSSTLTMFLL